MIFSGWIFRSLWLEDLPNCTCLFTSRDRLSHWLNHDSISVVSSRIVRQRACKPHICLKTTLKHKTRWLCLISFVALRPQRETLRHLINPALLALVIVYLKYKSQAHAQRVRERSAYSQGGDATREKNKNGNCKFTRSTWRWWFLSVFAVSFYIFVIRVIISND